MNVTIFTSATEVSISRAPTGVSLIKVLFKNLPGSTLKRHLATFNDTIFKLMGLSSSFLAQEV